MLEPATFLKSTLPHGSFSRFLNCTNGTKSRNALPITLKMFRILMSPVIQLVLRFEKERNNVRVFVPYTVKLHPKTINSGKNFNFSRQRY